MASHKAAPKHQPAQSGHGPVRTSPRPIEMLSGSNPHINHNHPSSVQGGMSLPTIAGRAVAARSHESLSFRPTKATGITPIGPIGVPNDNTVSLGGKRRRFNLLGRSQ